MVAMFRSEGKPKVAIERLEIKAGIGPAR